MPTTFPSRGAASWEPSVRRCPRPERAAAREQPLERLPETRLHARRLPRIRCPAAYRRPWQSLVLRGRFPDYRPARRSACSPRDSIWPYLDLPEYLRQSAAVAAWEEFYEHVVKTFACRPKCPWRNQPRRPVRSTAGRPGPRQGQRHLCDSPVCDMKSWPAVKARAWAAPAIGGRPSPPTVSPKSRCSPSRATGRRGAAHCRAPDPHPARRQRPRPGGAGGRKHRCFSPPAIAPPAVPSRSNRNTGMPDSANGHHFPLDDAARNRQLHSAP